MLNFMGDTINQRTPFFFIDFREDSALFMRLMWAFHASRQKI